MTQLQLSARARNGGLFWALYSSQTSPQHEHFCTVSWCIHITPTCRRLISPSLPHTAAATCFFFFMWMGQASSTFHGRKSVLEGRTAWGTFVLSSLFFYVRLGLDFFFFLIRIIMWNFVCLCVDVKSLSYFHSVSVLAVNSMSGE